MLLMKKDMGGAACALALALLLRRMEAPVELRVREPAVDNSIDAASFRPGDVVRSRKGLTVEIGNTDAEGRLVLADALAYASEATPDLLVDFATLTGAARVALGADLPPAFSGDESLAEQLKACGAVAGDPVWPMPLWDGYDDELSSRVADLGNVSSSGFAGAILGDALTKAAESNPELVFDFATLTGAARVALGADLQALFANDETLAADLLAAAEAEADPMWRMPLYDPYKEALKSDVADLVNAAEGPFGGAITAALFLKEFAPEKAQWAHFDIFCWNGSPKPGRPKGAEAVSLRATWKVLKDRYAG
jgi:leucyl aminopeptidase